MEFVRYTDPVDIKEFWDPTISGKQRKKEKSN